MKPFWFPIDPAAFLSDSLVDQMTTLELGACFRLLCRQWIDGDLPDDQEQLRRLARLSKDEMSEAWAVISKFFPVLSKGKRANRYANERRKEVESALSKRHDAGVKGAEKRWGSNSNAIPNAYQSHSNRNAIDISISKTKTINKIKQSNTNADMLDLLNKTLP